MPTKRLPDSFSNKWCKWMGYLKTCIEYPREHIWVVLCLTRFDVPVGNIVPNCMVNNLTSLGKPVVCELLFYIYSCVIKCTDYPVISYGSGLRWAHFPVLIYLVFNKT